MSPGTLGWEDEELLQLYVYVVKREMYRPS